MDLAIANYQLATAIRNFIHARHVSEAAVAETLPRLLFAQRIMASFVYDEAGVGTDSWIDYLLIHRDALQPLGVFRLCDMRFDAPAELKEGYYVAGPRVYPLKRFDTVEEAMSFVTELADIQVDRRTEQC